MNKNVRIVKTVTSMSKSLDAIASNVIAGEYTAVELKSKLSSVANVLKTTASAQKHILSQVRDINSFSTVASTTEYDDTLSVVLATQAQATLIGQMIRGELGIVAEDEEDDEEPTDNVEKAIAFDEEKTEPIEEPAKVEAGTQSDEVTKEESLEVTSASIGQGKNHEEINPQVKQVEKSGANAVPRKADGQAPLVKTTDSADASATALASQSSSRPMVSWNFN